MARFHKASISRALLGFLILGAAPALLAHDFGRHRCTQRGVAGTMGYVTTGTRVGVGPVAGVGITTFGEDGSVVGKQTVSFNGAIATETYTGTFEIDEDCTGSFTVVVTSSIPALNRTSTLYLVWEDDLNSAHAIFTAAGTVLTVEAHRVFTHGD